MKVDLDVLERVARDASTPDEWTWRRNVVTGDAILEGKHNGQVVLYADLEPGIVVSVGDRDHIAAASPPVTLAPIARIRELETIAKAAQDFALIQETRHPGEFAQAEFDALWKALETFEP